MCKVASTDKKQTAQKQTKRENKQVNIRTNFKPPVLVASRKHQFENDKRKDKMQIVEKLIVHKEKATKIVRKVKLKKVLCEAQTYEAQS